MLSFFHSLFEDVLKKKPFKHWYSCLHRICLKMLYLYIVTSSVYIVLFNHNKSMNHAPINIINCQKLPKYVTRASKIWEKHCWKYGRQHFFMHNAETGIWHDYIYNDFFRHIFWRPFWFFAKSEPKASSYTILKVIFGFST